MEEFVTELEGTYYNYEPLIDLIVTGKGFFPHWPLAGLPSQRKDQVHFIETEKILNALCYASNNRTTYSSVNIIPVIFVGSENNSPDFMNFFRMFRKLFAHKTEILEDLYGMLRKNESDTVLFPVANKVFKLSTAEFTDIVAGILFGGMPSNYEPQYLCPIWH